MNGAGDTFWDNVWQLRLRGLIPRVWKAGHIREHLKGLYKPNTINSVPINYSVEREGTKIGNAVKNGQAPKVWRVGPGDYQLITDPEDNAETQDTEKNRAEERATELRRDYIEPPPVVYDEPDRPRPHGESRAHLTSPRGGRYSGDRSVRANTYYPNRFGASDTAEDFSTAEKAEFIVLKYLVDKYEGQAQIEEDKGGADLMVSTDGKVERIEVKGTESSTIAWQKLKVSSQKSHDALESRDASIYRVVDVNGPRPRIYILTHGRDFTLEPEPRWAVKRVPSDDDRYPLRGEPYRFSRPHDPVAADEWEIQR